MSVPITRGRPYYSTFSTTTPLVPVENGNLTITIGQKYLYLPGCSVVVARNINRNVRFEAIVDSYDPSAPDIVLTQITNISGNWTNVSGDFIMSLTGQRGSKISAGNDDPDPEIGRTGDMYIKRSTGDVFLKY